MGVLVLQINLQNKLLFKLEIQQEVKCFYCSKRVFFFLLLFPDFHVFPTTYCRLYRTLATFTLKLNIVVILLMGVRDVSWQ